MVQFGSITKPLTKEQEQRLIEHSNTYWRKYGAKVVIPTIDNEPLDFCMVYYSVFISSNEPRFEWAYNLKLDELDRIIA